MNKKFIPALIFLCAFRVAAQDKAFFITNSNTPLGENYYQTAFFCTQVGEDIIYFNRLYDVPSADFSNYHVRLRKAKKSGEIIKEVSFDTDTAHTVGAWGSRAGDRISVYTLVCSRENVFVNYRLMTPDLEVLETHTQQIHGMNPKNAAGRVSLADLYMANDGDKLYTILSLQANVDRCVGFSLEPDGSLRLLKIFDGGFGDLSDDVLFFNPNEQTLEYIIHGYLKKVFDTDFKLLRIEDVPQNDSPIDTIGIKYTRYLQLDDDIYRFGTTRILYIDPDPFKDSVSLMREGWSMSLSDANMHPMGKMVWRDLNIGYASDGVPRLAGGLHYRDGVFYTLFENMMHAGEHFVANHFYITKFNKELEILEETVFVLNQNYRLFNYWAELTEDNAFISCG